MNNQNIDIKIKQQQKIIFQLNDLVSILIEELDFKYPDFKKNINNKFETIKSKIYDIKGIIKKNKYNLN
jgi:hypothetical protein